MPMYEYYCEPCKKRIEGYAPMADSALPRACDCGNMAYRVISPVRVFGDFQPYVSPASGRMIEGRRQREEDFRRTGTRPYELGERQEAIRRAAETEKEIDKAVEAAVDETITQLSL